MTVAADRSASQRASAQHVLESLGGSDTFALAVFAGSAAVGLGHAQSDVDVHVVLQPGARIERTTIDDDGYRVQLQVLDPDLVVRLVTLAEKYVVTRNDRSQSELTDYELWNFIRLVTGEVLSASDSFRQLLDRASFDVARQVVAANCAHHAARASQAASGMLGRGQAAAACHTAALAMAAACEVVLAATGDLYAVDRFLVARLERSPVLNRVFPELWELLYRFPPLDEEPAALAAAARARVFAASGLVAHSLLYGWDGTLGDVPALTAADAGGPVRSPQFGLLRFADTFGLAGRARSLRVGEAVAAVWAAADGSPVEEIARRVQSRGHEATLDTVTAALDALARADAVTYDGRSADEAREEVTHGPSVGDRG